MGCLSFAQVGVANLTLSLTHNELAPASMRFSLLGSRMKGEMKLVFLVAPTPQYSRESSSGKPSVIPRQM